MAGERYDPNSEEHKLPWPDESDPARVGEQFADPNASDDRRLGRNFEETNSSAKKRRKLPAEQVHKKKSHKLLYIFLICFFVLFALVLLIGWLPRHARDQETRRSAQEVKNAKPVVETETVERATSEAGLVVPGTTIPLTEAYIYARANGYLKTRYVDIGDHVKKNQLLAIIEAPDLDAQVSQARQQVFQAQRQLDQQEAQLALATVTVERYRVLVRKGVFSRQDGDQQEATFGSALANVAAAQRNVDAYKANLEHQIALQSFEYVRAPFAGVITERDVDVGALITAAGISSGQQTSPAPQGQNSAAGGTTQAGQTNSSGAAGGTSPAATSAQSPGQGGPLFGIAQLQRLRILVSVPEGYATAIHPGLRAPVEFQEYQNSKFTAEITRTSDSIDPNTRTMLAELQIDNSDGRLVSGMYSVVTFPPAPGVIFPVLINGDAIVIRSNHSMVAVVENGKIHFVRVAIGRDYGSAVEIDSGLKVGDIIVTDVTDDVVEGAEVQIHSAKPVDQQRQRPPKQTLPLGGNTQYGNEGLTNENLEGQQAQQNNKQQGKGKANSHGRIQSQKSSSESKQ